MSADNVIFIQKLRGRYWVWHTGYSNSNPEPIFTKCVYQDKNFATLYEANKYANQLEKDLGYVEYGIILRGEK